MLAELLLLGRQSRLHHQGLFWRILELGSLRLVVVVFAVARDPAGQRSIQVRKSDRLMRVGSCVRFEVEAGTSGAVGIDAFVGS